MQPSYHKPQVKKISPLLLCTVLLSGCRQPASPPAAPPQQTFEHDYGLAMSRGEFESRGRNGTVSTRQETGQLLKQHFENGKLQGMSTCTFPFSKQAAYCENYDRGCLIFRVDYHLSGMPQKESTYLPSQVEEVKTWFEDGVPRCVECYQGRQLLQGTYFAPTAEREAQILDGEGLGVVRSSTGQLLQRFETREGYPTWRRVFYPSGDLKEFYRYQVGQLHGECRFYSEGGVPECFQNWQCDKREGLTSYFERGEVVAEVPYKDDQKHGTEKRYCRAKMVETVEWKRGQLHGPSCQFDRDGQVLSQNYFYRDRPVSRLIFENLVLN